MSTLVVHSKPATAAGRLEARSKRNTPGLARLGLALGVAAATLGLSSGSALGHFERSYYTYNSGCKAIKDPLNVMFRGKGAHAANAAAHLAHHTGWNSSSGGFQEFSPDLAPR